MKKLLAVLALFTALPALAAETPPESVYDRVMRTNTIRCGYFVYAPYLVKDANTGAMSGIYYDYMNALAANLSLKVDWAEEIGLGDFPSALKSGRIDAMCTSIWITAARSRGNDFIAPTFYLPLYLYTRAGDMRFDDNPLKMNDPQYTLAILEGGATDAIQREIFPQSKGYVLPQLTSPAELFVSLANNKADGVIYEPQTYANFEAKNPGKIRRASDKPIKVFPSSIPVKQGEEEFRQMLSHATIEMQLSGQLDKILDKYVLTPDSIYHVAKPYDDR